ncbi:MAG: peptide chain release factor N(5)-glutamine methyltransferase [Gammaproteobacteria bacterium]
MTTAELLASARAALKRSSSTPNLDAEVLLAHALKSFRSSLLAHPERVPSSAEQQAFEFLLNARCNGQPIAYLIGQREFWSLALKVTPATLIPRPETELLVEQSLQLELHTRAARILDLGTGSGAVALALATERPAWAITATDISPATLAVAAQNAATFGIHNVEFLQGDWYAPVSRRRFELIVSNPPYVASDDPHLQSGDPRFEPVQGLDGGPDGLTAIRQIVQHAKDHLLPNATLLLEHGQSQAPAVRTLLLATGFENVHTLRDLPGSERVSSGTLTA